MRPDDLEPGQWVAVQALLGAACAGERCDCYTCRSARGELFTGDPFEVLAVALPFVAVRNLAGRVSSLDVRALGLVRVGENYVAARRADGQTSSPPDPPETITPPRRIVCPSCSSIFALSGAIPPRIPCMNCGCEIATDASPGPSPGPSAAC